MPDPWTIQTGSGIVRIELYEPGTFASEPIRIQTDNGPMVPYVTNTADADTGLRVHTQSGTKGINSVGILRIDDFEDGNRGGWTVPSSTGGDDVISPGLNNSSNRWQMQNFRQGHLRGADAVDRGPQPGDIFVFWIRVDDVQGDVINRVEFSADGIDEPDCYRVEFETNTSGNEFSIEKIQNGNQALIDTDVGSVNEGWEYRCQVEWNVGNNDINVQFFLPNGNAASSQMTITDNSSGDFAQPGIAIRNSANNVCSYDEFKILPS